MHCIKASFLLLLGLLFIQDTLAWWRVFSPEELVKNCKNVAPCKEKGWYKVGQRCVKYFSLQTTFDKAEAICKRLHKDGHMVSIHSKEEQDAVSCLSLRSKPLNPRIWLGGRMHDNRKFYWLDGSDFNFCHWVPGQPDYTAQAERCMEMNWAYLSYWNDHRCWKKKSFLCSKPQ